MTTRMTRRRALQGLGVAGAAALLRIDTDAAGQDLTIAGQPVELRLAAVSRSTVRVSVLPRGAAAAVLNSDGGLVDFPEQRRIAADGATLTIGDLRVAVAT